VGAGTGRSGGDSSCRGGRGQGDGRRRLAAENRFRRQSRACLVPTAFRAAQIEVPAGQKLDLELQSPLSSNTAKVDDRVEAKITREVRVGSVVAVPAGSLIVGTVTVVDRPETTGRRARLGVRFHTLAIEGASEIPLVLDELIYEVPFLADIAPSVGGDAGNEALGWLPRQTVTRHLVGALGNNVGAYRKSAYLPMGAQARVKLLAPVSITR